MKRRTFLQSVIGILVAPFVMKSKVKKGLTSEQLRKIIEVLESANPKQCSLFTIRIEQRKCEIWACDEDGEKPKITI